MPLVPERLRRRGCDLLRTSFEVKEASNEFLMSATDASVDSVFASLLAESSPLLGFSVAHGSSFISLRRTASSFPCRFSAILFVSACASCLAPVTVPVDTLVLVARGGPVGKGSTESSALGILSI